MAKRNEVSWITQDYLKRWIPLGSYYFLISFFIFTTGFFIFANSIKLANNVFAVGSLNSEQAPVPIKAPISFEIDQVFVKENQPVQKDDKIVSSKDSFSAADVTQLEKYRDSLLAVIKDLKADPNCKTCIEKIQSAQALHSSFIENVDIIETIGAVQTTSLDLKRQIEETQSLGIQTADIRQNIILIEQKIAGIKKQKAEQILAKEYEQLNQELLSLKTKLRSKQQENLLNIKRSLGQLEAAMSDFQSRLQKKTESFTITAPFDGTTSSLKIKGKGEIIAPGEVILELIPIGTKIVAELNIAAKDIPLVRKDMEVVMTFDAFPEAEYGSVSGQILSIDRFEGVGPNSQVETSFRAKVALPIQSMKSGDKTFPFVIGMAVNGKILVGQETLLQMIMNKIFHLRSQIQ